MGVEETCVKSTRRGTFLCYPWRTHRPLRTKKQCLNSVPSGCKGLKDSNVRFLTLGQDMKAFMEVTPEPLLCQHCELKSPWIPRSHGYPGLIDTQVSWIPRSHGHPAWTPAEDCAFSITWVQTKLDLVCVNQNFHAYRSTRTESATRAICAWPCCDAM